MFVCAKFIALRTFTRGSSERPACLCAGIRMQALQLHETYSRGQGRCPIVADKKEGPDSDAREKLAHGDPCYSSSQAPSCSTNRDKARRGFLHHASVAHGEDKPQASSTRYFLRVLVTVVTVVTSVTIVPKSSRSDSACWVRVEDCPVPSPSYEGGNSCSAFSVGERGSIFTGINFHINKGAESRPLSGAQIVT